MLISFFTTPLAFPFMQRAFVEAILIGILCGAVGSFMVLRGLAFIADALSHAIFPGVVIAYLNKIPVQVGALAFGVLTALGIAVLARNRKVSEDTSIGIVFAGFFALGVVLISTVKSYIADLNSFLFGHVLAVSYGDIALTAAVGAAILLAIVLLYKELTFASFDAASAQAQGLPVFALDLLLLVLLTMTIILALTAVGIILVLALLITPAATARLLVNRLSTMMLAGAALGALAAILGTYVAYYGKLAPGGTMVLVSTLLFVLVFAFSSRGGAVAWLARRRTPVRASARSYSPSRSSAGR